MKAVVTILLFWVISIAASAQTVSHPMMPDSKYDREVFARFWRKAYLTNPANEPLMHIIDKSGDTVSLNKLLFRSALENGIVAYSNETCSDILDKKKIARYQNVADTTTLFHVGMTVFYDELEHDNFNTKSGCKMQALGPAYEGNDSIVKPMFWIKYDDVRKEWKKRYSIVVNGKRMPLTYYLEDRMFKSSLYNSIPKFNHNHALQKRISQNDGIIWQRNTTKHLNLDSPANQVLMHVHGEKAEEYHIVDILLNHLLTDTLESKTEHTNGVRLTKEQLSEIRQKTNADSLHITSILFYGEAYFEKYDKKKGRMVVRILALAPTYKSANNNFMPLFWIDYKAWTSTLDNYHVYSDDKEMPLTDFLGYRYYSTPPKDVPFTD